MTRVTQMSNIVAFPSSSHAGAVVVSGFAWRVARRPVVLGRSAGAAAVLMKGNNSSVIFAPVTARTVAFAPPAGVTVGISTPSAGQIFPNVTCAATGTTGVCQFQTNITLNSADLLNLTEGTLDASTFNVNVSTGNFEAAGSSTRVVDCGTAAWAITGPSLDSNSLTWDYSSTTGLTSNCTSTPIAFTNSAPTTIRIFSMGGQTFGPITISGAAAPSSNYPFFIEGSGATVASLAVDAPVPVVFPANATFTISGGITTSGGSLSAMSTMTSSSPTGTTTTSGLATISVGSNSALSWVSFFQINFTGAGTVTADHSIDLGHNAGVAITVPPPTNGGNHIL
jgi:hypothetical protein